MRGRWWEICNNADEGRSQWAGSQSSVYFADRRVNMLFDMSKHQPQSRLNIVPRRWDNDEKCKVVDNVVCMVCMYNDDSVYIFEPSAWMQ